MKTQIKTVTLTICVGSCKRNPRVEWGGTYEILKASLVFRVEKLPNGYDRYHLPDEITALPPNPDWDDEPREFFEGVGAISDGDYFDNIDCDFSERYLGYDALRAKWAEEEERKYREYEAAHLLLPGEQPAA